MRRHDPFERIPLPLWWKLWAAFCIVFGLAFAAFIVWAVVTALHIWEAK